MRIIAGLGACLECNVSVMCESAETRHGRVMFGGSCGRENRRVSFCIQDSLAGVC